MSGNRNVLKMTIAVPTLAEVPEDDATECDYVQAKVKASVDVPDNWHDLQTKWKACLATELVTRVLQASLMTLDSREEKMEFVLEFRRQLGIGNTEDE